MAEFDVVHVSRYSFEDNGKPIRGAKVTALSASVENNSDSKGREVLVFSASYEFFQKFPRVPARYNLELIPKMSGGKTKVVLGDTVTLVEGK